MKTIIQVTKRNEDRRTSIGIALSKGSKVQRVSDEKARELVTGGQWVYCPKSIHKGGEAHVINVPIQTLWGWNLTLI